MHAKNLRICGLCSQQAWSEELSSRLTAVRLAADDLNTGGQQRQQIAFSPGVLSPVKCLIHELKVKIEGVLFGHNPEECEETVEVSVWWNARIAAT